MNYNFEFNSPAIGRIQPFEYSYATTNEYAFTYGRDIFSDLSKFNAPIFVERKRRGIFSYDKIYIAEKINNLNIKTKDYFIKRIKNGFDIKSTDKLLLESKNGFVINEDNIIMKKERNGFTISENNLFGEKDIHLNIFKEILAKEYINNLDLFTGYFAENYIPKKITIVDMKHLEKEFSLEIYDNYFLSEYDIKHLNIYQSTLLEKPIFNLNVYKNILSKKPDSNVLSVYDTILLYDSMPINKLSIYHNYMLLTETNINNMNIYDNYFMKRPVNNNISIYKNFMLSELYTNNLSIYSFINASINEINKINIYKQIKVKKEDILKINIYDNLMLNKIYNNSLYINKQKSGKISLDNCYYNKYILNGTINKEQLKLFNKMNTGIKPLKDFNIQQYKIPKLAKYKKRLIKSRDIILGYRSKRKTCFRKENLFVYKFNHDMFIKENILLSKDNHDFNINDTELYLYSLEKELYIKNNTKFLHRERYGFSINDIKILLNKDKHNIFINSTEKTLNKNKHDFVINNTEYIIKNTRKGFNFDDFTEFIYKDRYSFSVNVSEVSLDKIELPLGIVIHDNTIGLILPEKETHIDNNKYLLNNKARNSLIETINIFTEKENKQANVSNNISNVFVISEQRKAFIEYYHNYMLSKNIKSCLIDITNEFVEKQKKDAIMYNSIIFITKDMKNTFIKKEFHITKKQKKSLKDNELIKVIKYYKETYLCNTDIPLDKIEKIITIIDSIWINKKLYLSDIFKQDILSKEIYETSIVENNIFINRAEHELTKNTYLDVDIKQKNIFEHEGINIIKEKTNINIQDYVFITKQQYKTNPYVSEMEHMQKIIKDLEKPVEKTYNWAYVYQYDDPIDPNYDYYGIDELLLPEKDIDYSTFENIIFNKKTMTPKRPIKVIDDNTFIAKYPIEHPTPNYEEVGIVYIDVPTDLMYAIFTKFYQIWYANIFKFGNMSMVDSLKLMLDYMYSHIIITYSGSEYLEPALRVFRQIRWFGETSVMHNAQYKITCEYEDLKSNLQTGECMIENELSGFFIDTNLKVLSNESTSIGQETYIKLYTSNKEESQITFSISLTAGNVDVYINDLHVDTIYSNHASISYDLPATDTKNEIILKRSASNNLGHCYIGNIIIKNGTYKNLSIEYDPELKAGNMPLNDIVNKMVILANMYDDEQEVFNQFREGNLAISELYKRLENYWEFHHANKIKGKRLTIKET